MSVEPPPSNNNSGYNPSDWTQGDAPVDQQFLAENYLQFPNAQGQETLATTIISGTLTTQDTSTFEDIVNLNASTTANADFTINKNLITPNNFLINTSTQFTDTVDLGSSATAVKQPAGNNSLSVATTSFVQDAIQVSGVQTTDSPLLWSGFNTWQTNNGIGNNFPYGLSAVWNVSDGGGDCSLISNSGTGLNGQLNVYLASSVSPNTATINNTTVPALKVLTTGLNIPAGNTYNVNNQNILNNTALLGTPTAPTYTSGSTQQIANVDYVQTAIAGGSGSYAPATNAGAGNYAYQNGDASSPYVSVLNQHQVGPLNTSQYSTLSADAYLNGLLTMNQNGPYLNFGFRNGGCYLFSINPNTGYADDVLISTITAGYGNSGNQINAYTTQTGQFKIQLNNTIPSANSVYLTIIPNSSQYYNYTIRVIRLT